MRCRSFFYARIGKIGIYNYIWIFVYVKTNTNMIFRDIEHRNSKEIKERIRDWNTREWKKDV